MSKACTEYRKGLTDQIIAEAYKRFSEKGIKSVTMDDIAKGLHISKRTIYELYSNKEELLLGVLQQGHEKRKKDVAELVKHCDSAVDVMTEVFRLQLEMSMTVSSDFFRDIQRYPKARRLLQKYDAEHQESAVAFFARGVEEGYFLSNIDFGIFMEVSSGILDVIKTDSICRNLSFTDLLKNYVCVLMRGICTREGLEKFDEFLKVNGIS